MKLLINISENGYETLERMRGNLSYFHEIILNGIPISDNHEGEYVKRSEIESRIDKVYEDLDVYDPNASGVFYDNVIEALYSSQTFSIPDIETGRKQR